MSKCDHIAKDRGQERQIPFAANGKCGARPRSTQAFSALNPQAAEYLVVAALTTGPTP